MTTYPGKVWLTLCFALILAFSIPAALASEEPSQPENPTEVPESVEQDVQAKVDEQAGEQRRMVMQQAVDALAQTRDALTAMEEERIDDALEALAIATGKLELIVARHPELALAPTDVTIVTHDLYATPDAIEGVIDRAKDELDEGRIQQARRLLEGLASELVFSVNNLPLATYPDAIKSVVPLIDKGEMQKAKAELRAALNTLVVTEHIVPLPVLRTNALLDHAEELSEKTDRTEEENEQLANHIKGIRDQLEIAELLGYVDEEAYPSLYRELDELERQAASGESGSGYFDGIRRSISRLWESVLS